MLFSSGWSLNYERVRCGRKGSGEDRGRGLGSGKLLGVYYTIIRNPQKSSIGNH